MLKRFEIDVADGLGDSIDGVADCLEAENIGSQAADPDIVIVTRSTGQSADGMKQWVSTVYVGATPIEISQDLNTPTT
jgi:hypothetical protein